MTFRVQLVDFMPADLAEGVLYVAPRFGAVLHRCACGCGQEVVTPLDQGWRLRLEGDRATLRPSIGNWQFPCRSHYYITDNQVEWL